MARDYPRLDIEPFGRHLLATGDLDPVYIALHALGQDGKLSMPARNRWLLSYWCFYHVGQACYMAELGTAPFWEAMIGCATNVGPAPTGERWQRGHERRHARGVQGIRMVRLLRGESSAGADPSEIVGEIMRAGTTYPEVSGAAAKLHGFGPWISFKVADMIDRCTMKTVQFLPEQVFDMFDSPREAALMLWRQRMGLPDGARPKDEKFALRSVYEHLQTVFQDFTAPPKDDRPVGIQEIETILCKWKSHLSGHYPLNNDIREIRDGLVPWHAHSKLAREFTESMPLAEAVA